MKLFLTPQAEKQLKRLPQSNRKKIYKKLSYLEENPNSGKKLLGELGSIWSLKVWPYRIIYLIRRRQVWVVSILHRQRAYKK